MKEDGQAVVCLLGSYGHHSVPYVRPSDFNHVRISEGCEGAEAEQIPGAPHPGRFGYGLLILLSIHILQFDHGAVLGDFQRVELFQLRLSEEDDRLLDKFEYWFIGLHVAHLV